MGIERGENHSTDFMRLVEFEGPVFESGDFPGAGPRTFHEKKTECAFEVGPVVSEAIDGKRLVVKISKCSREVIQSKVVIRVDMGDHNRLELGNRFGREVE